MYSEKEKIIMSVGLYSGVGAALMAFSISSFIFPKETFSPVLEMILGFAMILLAKYIKSKMLKT